MLDLLILAALAFLLGLVFGGTAAIVAYSALIMDALRRSEIEPEGERRGRSPRGRSSARAGACIPARSDTKDSTDVPISQ